MIPNKAILALERRFQEELRKPGGPDLVSLVDQVADQFDVDGEELADEWRAFLVRSAGVL